jgi:1-carboxybiuret hydrolase
LKEKIASKNPALAIAAGVLARERSARSVIEATLADIAARDGDIHAFTHVAAERALTEAAEVDAAIAAGRHPGPLAGVPFAVKDLFDIAGIATKAGSKIHAARPAAARDATAIRRLNAAGAILVPGRIEGQPLSKVLAAFALSHRQIVKHNSSRV